MFLHVLIAIIAFMIAAAGTGLILHLSGYKKQKSCACGHFRTCTSGESGSCRTTGR